MRSNPYGASCLLHSNNSLLKLSKQRKCSRPNAVKQQQKVCWVNVCVPRLQHIFPATNLEKHKYFLIHICIPRYIWIQGDKSINPLILKQNLDLARLIVGKRQRCQRCWGGARDTRLLCPRNCERRHHGHVMAIMSNEKSLFKFEFRFIPTRADYAVLLALLICGTSAVIEMRPNIFQLQTTISISMYKMLFASKVYFIYLN